MSLFLLILVVVVGIVLKVYDSAGGTMSFIGIGLIVVGVVGSLSNAGWIIVIRTSHSSEYDANGYDDATGGNYE